MKSTFDPAIGRTGHFIVGRKAKARQEPDKRSQETQL